MGPIFGLIGHIFLDLFGHCGQIFHFFRVFLAPVDGLKCIDSKNTLDFHYRPILMVSKWLRNQNGRVQILYGA